MQSCVISCETILFSKISQPYTVIAYSLIPILLWHGEQSDPMNNDWIANFNCCEFYLLKVCKEIVLGIKTGNSLSLFLPFQKIDMGRIIDLRGLVKCHKFLKRNVLNSYPSVWRKGRIKCHELENGGKWHI